MKNNKTFKIFKSIGNFLLTTVLIFMLIIIIIQRVSNNNFAIGGIRIFSVISDSMEPDYKIGDILISQEVSMSEIKVGDDVTYLGKEGDFDGIVVTHRVVNKFEENGKVNFVTQGTANDIVDPTINEDDVYGKVVYKTFVFSFLGNLMSNVIIYYSLFIVIGIIVSYQIIRGFINPKDEDEEDEDVGSNKKGD